MKSYIKIASVSLVFLSATITGSFAEIETIEKGPWPVIPAGMAEQKESADIKDESTEEKLSASFLSSMGGYAWSGASTLGNMAFNVVWNSADQYVRNKIAITLAGLYINPLIEGTATAAYYGGYVLGGITPFPGAAPVLGTTSYAAVKATLHGIRYVPGADTLLVTGFAMGLRYVIDPAIDYAIVPAAKAVAPSITNAAYSLATAGYSRLCSWYKG